MDTKDQYIKRLTNRQPSNPEQALLYARVLDRLFFCVKRQTRAFTDFLDPTTFGALMETLTKPPIDEVTIMGFGGAPECERHILGFAPAYDQDALTTADFPIARLRVTFNGKFHKAPAHRDLLGAVLGLGIDRSKVGDIRPSDAFLDVYVHEEIAAFVCENLSAAGRTPVTARLITDTDLEPEAAEIRETMLTVASLRLDAVIAAAFRLSRGQASALIAGGKAFVNWLPAVQPGKIVNLQDMITVRGLGRVRLLAVDGHTKKDRVRLRVQVF